MKFPSLSAGLDYHTHCPVCSSPMKINELDAQITHKYERDGGLTRTLTWHCDGRDTLTVDLDTHEFSLSVKSDTIPVYGSRAGALNYNFSSFSGLMYNGLRISCNTCCQYEYCLKVICDIDAEKKGTLKVELNSETLSIEDNVGMLLHEIRNIYSCNRTEYMLYTKDHTSTRWEDKTITLPLIPLNTSNPTETLQRIKTLVLFS